MFISWIVTAMSHTVPLCQRVQAMRMANIMVWMTGADMLIAFRAYIEEATGVGPDYNEIVYDRAIVFHKPQ